MYYIAVISASRNMTRRLLAPPRAGFTYITLFGVFLAVYGSYYIAMVDRLDPAYFEMLVR